LSHPLRLELIKGTQLQSVLTNILLFRCLRYFDLLFQQAFFAAGWLTWRLLWRFFWWRLRAGWWFFCHFLWWYDCWRRF
jgi:hypothetical protein